MKTAEKARLSHLPGSKRSPPREHAADIVASFSPIVAPSGAHRTAVLSSALAALSMSRVPSSSASVLPTHA